MKLKNLADTGTRLLFWRRVIVYGVLMLLLCVLQCAFFSVLLPFGGVPDIVLGGICALCMLDNKRVAAVCAVGGGYFLYALGSPTLAFSPLFYLLAVVVIGKICEKMMPGFISFAVCTLPAAAMGALYTFVNLWISLGVFPPIKVTVGALLPYILSTVICSLGVYFLVKPATVIVLPHR